jgi:septum formation protein
MEWILASASPRRKELFAELVEKFEIIPAQGEEKTEAGLTPKQLVQALAKQKALEVASMPSAKGKFVLGADTVVALGDEVLGKPKDEADAKRMLTALSGRSHDVYTGVCIVYLDENDNPITLVDAARTEVVFETLSKEQIDAYVASGSPMDKAGAYGIQDGGLVKEIKGSYSNVVGLPMELLEGLIKVVLAGAGTR